MLLQEYMMGTQTSPAYFSRSCFAPTSVKDAYRHGLLEPTDLPYLLDRMEDSKVAIILGVLPSLRVV